MVRGRVLVTIVTIQVLATRAAEADWYYRYSCSGACAPEQLAAVGLSPGYPTQADCDAARGADPRRYTNQESGSLGGLSLCFESEQPPRDDASLDNRPPPPFQGLAVGLIGGPGYRAANEQAGAVTAGIDAAFAFSAWPTLGLVLRTGLRGSAFDGAMTNLALLWPVTLGLKFSLGSRRTRIEFGADGGFEVPAACPGCPPTAGVAALHLGIVHFFDTTMDLKPRDRAARPGLALEVVKEFRTGPLEPPLALVRVTFRARNDRLPW